MFSKKLVAAFVLLTSLHFMYPCYAEDAKQMKFSNYMEFQNGSDSAKLLWITEPDGTPNIGVLQCPMSFVSLVDGNTWIADTQNARLCLFSKDGKNLKEINLLELGKKAGLADPPAIVDICLSNGNILAGDAASNSVLEINPETLAMRVFKSPGTDNGGWFQISHLFTDNQQRIYIDDLALGKIIVLDKDGKYLGDNAAASIAVSKTDSSMASIHYVEETDGEAEASYYQITVNKGFTTPWYPIVNINTDNESIIYINIIGIDKNNDIYVLFETESTRFYQVFNMKGELKKSFTAYPMIPMINPARPDWIDENGNIYSAVVVGNSLKILKYTAE